MSLSFSDTFDADTEPKARKRLKLLEAEPSLVASLEAGDEVRFVHNDDAKDVVLCTPTETFKVTKVESSNTTLLVAGGVEAGASVVARSSVTFHWEARKCAPRVDVGAGLPEYGGGDSADAPTLADLRSRTQASAAELDAALKDGKVLEVSGRYFSLQPKTLHRTLDNVLTSVSIRGWPASAVPVKACAADAATHGADAVVAAHCLRHFAVDGGAAAATVALDARAVAVAVAPALFVAKATYEDVDAFLADLKDCLPSGAEPALSWLDGVVAVSGDGAVSLAADA